MSDLRHIILDRRNYIFLEYKLLLWKELSSNNVPCDIQNPNKNISYYFPPEHQIFFIDMSCNGTKMVLEQGNQMDLFKQPFRWIILSDGDYEDFKNYYYRLDSQIFVVENLEKENYVYKIKALYKVSKDSSEFLENDIARWNSKQGFFKYDELSFSRNRTNLKGLNLNISYVVTNSDTYKHLEDYRNTHIDPLSKLNWLIMKYLLVILNATSTPIFDTTWGYRDSNTSKFTGMIGDLQSDRAEIGGTALFFTIDRIDVIEYVAPSAPTYAKFIFRAPPLSYVSNVFTLPFDTDVWYSCFGLVPLIFIVIYIIVKWEWKDPTFREKVQENNSNSVVPLRPGFFDVLVMELGAVTQQGAESEPKSNAGRIATIFAFIATMFLYTSYSANIVAILQSTTESIKTLEDLLNSRISLGVEDIVYSHYYFKTADEPIRKAIYQQKIAPKGQKPNFMTMQEGISRVQKGFFAFHVEVSSGYKMIGNTFQESEKCSLKEIVFINLIEPWVSIKKGSAYKEIIKVGLRKMLENGIQRRDTNRIYTKKPVCQSKGSNFGSAGILDCYAAFLIFASGVIFSLILLIFEILAIKKMKSRETNANMSY
ncbi:ionotropic receptor 75a-like [Diorhabda sublineata]|uniref:ionotropic receptor 75a-like n=1 Tax=Diorhabda sublineata TaxID=1163346 RepID=UPI0024E06EA1|nr:ionotropic receptor 75a-like [Diorhabda sublineata]